MKTFLILIGAGVLVSIVLGLFAISAIKDLNTELSSQKELTAKILTELEKIKNSPAIRKAAPRNARQPKIATVSIDDDPVKGSPDAPVTIVEFSDYECPFCKKFYDNAYRQIKEEYIDKGKVKMVFRDYPLPFHKKAIPAALAANCAGEQGKYWEVHDYFFENPRKLDRESIMISAKEFDVDYGQFEKCMNDETKITEIKKDMADAKKYGVTGTPAFFIGKTGDGKEITGVLVGGARPFESFKSEIDPLLEGQPK